MMDADEVGGLISRGPIEVARRRFTHVDVVRHPFAQRIFIADETRAGAAETNPVVQTNLAEEKDDVS